MPQDGGTLNDLQAYLRANGIVNFSAHELAPVGRAAQGWGISLKMPPQKLWEYIVPTLLILEELRAHFGHPVEVLSGYRDPRYNAAVGGARDSMHTWFNAVDFRVDGVGNTVLGRWLHGHHDTKKLGVGVYQSWCHVDTRAVLGRDGGARWSGTNEQWWL